MQVNFDEVMARYEAEISVLTRRLIMAEIERDTLANQLDQQAGGEDSE